MFLDVLTGFPGSVDDAKLLRASTLYQKCEANELLTHPEKIIEEMRIRALLLKEEVSLLNNVVSQTITK